MLQARRELAGSSRCCPAPIASAPAFPASCAAETQRHFSWPGGLQRKMYPENGTTQEKQQRQVTCLSRGTFSTPHGTLGTPLQAAEPTPLSAEHTVTSAPGQTHPRGFRGCERLCAGAAGWVHKACPRVPLLGLGLLCLHALTEPGDVRVLVCSSGRQEAMVTSI